MPSRKVFLIWRQIILDVSSQERKENRRNYYYYYYSIRFFFLSSFIIKSPRTFYTSHNKVTNRQTGSMTRLLEWRFFPESWTKIRKFLFLFPALSLSLSLCFCLSLSLSIHLASYLSLLYKYTSFSFIHIYLSILAFHICIFQTFHIYLRLFIYLIPFVIYIYLAI